MWILCLSLLLIQYCTSYDFPFQDPSLSWDERTDDLVSRLTLEEIVPQTMAIYNNHTPAIDRLGIKPYVWITECLRGQEGTDATAFPQSIGLAASFSEELVFKMSEAISYELRAHWNYNRARGVYLCKYGLSCFSPVINIMRHPLWGRNQETYGEDPYLSGKLVQNYVNGLQGDDPRYVRANAGCKHFDVHGGPEDIPVSRFPFDSKVSMRDWRMTFLPQFKMCVEAGTYSLMCSYNSINGVPACANKQLLTDIIRKEWGFDGYIVSDAGAISNIISAHKYKDNAVDALTAAIEAGTNLELGSDLYSHQLEAAQAGKLTEKELRDNVRPLMYTRLRLGEFDPEDMVPFNKIGMDVVQSLKHRELAIQAAYMTFTLLKNDGDILPITQIYNKVAIVGPFTRMTDQLYGDYSPNVMSEYLTTVYDGLSRLGITAQGESGCSDPQCEDYNSHSMRSAIEGAEIIFVALGTGQQLEAEGRDRQYLDLPGKQLQILQDAVHYGKGIPVVLLLFNAGPLDITWAKQNPGVRAIMECYFPAQSTGEALFRSLTLSDPKAAPAGRLPATWPANLNQIPEITNYTMVGRTYRYYDGDPLYPFGYGLSYSLFAYTRLNIFPNEIIGGENCHMEVCLTNIGKYASYEVVQLYMSWPESSVPLPKIQLVGFERLFFDAGASMCTFFTVRAEQMAVWISDEIGFGFIPGKMKVYAGGQQPHQRTEASSNVLEGTFTLKTTKENKLFQSNEEVQNPFIKL